MLKWVYLTAFLFLVITAKLGYDTWNDSFGSLSTLIWVAWGAAATAMIATLVSFMRQPRIEALDSNKEGSVSYFEHYPAINTDRASEIFRFSGEAANWEVDSGARRLTTLFTLYWSHQMSENTFMAFRRYETRDVFLIESAFHKRRISITIDYPGHHRCKGIVTIVRQHDEDKPIARQFRDPVIDAKFCKEHIENFIYPEEQKEAYSAWLGKVVHVAKNDIEYTNSMIKGDLLEKWNKLQGSLKNGYEWWALVYKNQPAAAKLQTTGAESSLIHHIYKNGMGPYAIRYYYMKDNASRYERS